jgi:hypothetical protein
MMQPARLHHQEQAITFTLPPLGVSVLRLATRVHEG